MTADQFAYWLQGFTELHGEPPSPEQWASIKEHLSLVFKKVTAPVQRVDQLPRQPSDATPMVWGESLKWLESQPQCAVTC
jgi:hypothetical protein